MLSWITILACAETCFESEIFRFDFSSCILLNAFEESC